MASGGARANSLSRMEGKDLKERRLRIGISTAALAKRAGIDRGALANIERGDSAPQERTVAKIDKALSDLEQEMGLDVEEPAPSPSNVVTFTVKGNYGVDVTVAGPLESLRNHFERWSTEIIKASTQPEMEGPQ